MTRVDVLLVIVAATPPIVTAVAPDRFVPLIVTDEPTQPALGVKDVIAGPPAVTVKLLELVPVPDGVVTVMAPVEAPVGTVAVIWVAELTVNVAVVPANRTAVAPVKFVPVMTTEVPGAPLVGEKPVTVGAGVAVTSKLVELVPVPAGFTTEMAPSVAPVGTVAVICVAELTVNVEFVPLKRTAVAPVKLVPVIVTEVPTGPLVGVKPVTVGVWVAVTVNVDGQSSVPP
jgi:hypothetical protein